MANISIVIPVYGQWELVKKNIDGFLKFDREYIKEILVVDDHSPQPNPFAFDNSNVTVLTKEKNLGYAGTVNHGLRMASSEIVILLDSDAYPIHSIVPQVMNIFEKDQDLGCLGFSTVDEAGRKTGSSQKEPTVLGYILGQRLEAKYEAFTLLKCRPKVPYTCSVAYRKACLEDLGYFDEKTFPSIECDLDLNMRIYQSKWKIFETGEITVCHSGGNSYKVDNRRVSMFHELRWKLLRKHNKIKYPFLTKKMVMLRIITEMVIMTMLIAIDIDRPDNSEKLKGRKALLNAVSSYE